MAVWNSARARAWVILASVVAVVVAVLAAAPASAATVRVSFVKVLAGGSLVQPVGIVGARNGSRHLYLIERRGTVRALDTRTGRRLPGYFIDLRSVVRSSGGEQGLLGMAFDPRYASGRPYVFVAYTAGDGALHVMRLRASSASADSVPASSRRLVLAVAHNRFSNHNAGQLLFSGGLLYIGTGDGGGAGDPLDNARNLRTLSGKILRLDVSRSCAGRLFCIPASNPYARSSPARREIWAYGLRNPWRFSADRGNGRLWVGDVGQNRYEEIDVLGTRPGGANLGWSCREGPAVYNSARCTAAARRAPYLWYSHSRGEAIIGGYVYRGASYARVIGGRYFFGDYASGRVWMTTGTGTYRQVTTLPRVTAFGEGELGEQWAVTYDGALWRLSARAG